MNLSTLEEIVGLLDEHAVTEIDANLDGERVHVRRAHVPVSLAAAVAPPPQAFAPEADAVLHDDANVPDVFVLHAPMVGLFHHASPPLGVGASVVAGQKIGAIEAMKLMNDVVANEAGRVLEILTEDGAPTEYGQPLLRLSRL